MQNTIAGQNRRLWVATCLALLLVVFLLSIWFGPKLPDIVSIAKPQNSATQGPLHLSPADAARRAAIAKLGPIDAELKSNAADTYKRAMALYNKLTPSEKDFLSHWRDRKPPETAADFSTKLQPILQLLAVARTQGPSIWGDNPLSSADRDARINMMQGLTQAAQWQANHQFQSDPAGALQNLADAEALDRSSSGVMYGYANYSALHDDTLALIAQNAQFLPAYPSAQMSDLNYLTDPEGVAETTQSILNAQAAQLQSVVDEYANPATRSQAAQFITNEFNAYGTDPATAVNAMQFILQTDQQLANNLTDTNAQFQDWYVQMKAQAASIPAIDWAAPTIQHQYETYENSEILDAMLNAGVALQQGNPSLSQSILDPVTGRPFGVSTTGEADPTSLTNTSLSSTFNYNGRPVTLRFGPPAVAPTSGAVIAAP